jgi:ubiquinone/menaquinone biosynthesis C-methylase UbiE
MKYQGKELENFDLAKFWRKYIYFQIKLFLKNEILEVGAGIGSFTKNYKDSFSRITLIEPDKYNFKQLKKNLKSKNITILNTSIKKIKKKFNCILYMNVLEHIKDHEKEINFAISKLYRNGFLIILVPAHQKLFTEFDKAVGHYRRYSMNFFKKKFKNSVLEKLIFLDFFGYFLYFFNNLFLKKEVYPSKFKILIWDKIFTPITIVIDFLIRYKFGKNILCIYKKI